MLAELVAKYIEGPNMFKMLKLGYGYNNFDVPEVVCTTMLLNLMTSILQKYVTVGLTIEMDTLERVFVFSLCWSMAGLCEQEDREKFHRWLEKIEAPLPKIAYQ